MSISKFIVNYSLFMCVWKFSFKKLKTKFSTMLCCDSMPSNNVLTWCSSSSVPEKGL